MEKLSFELQNLLAACQQNLYHTQKLLKQAHDQNIKLQSYALDEKMRWNSKQLKLKQNFKLKAKFFEFF